MDFKTEKQAFIGLDEKDYRERIVLFSYIKIQIAQDKTPCKSI